MVRYLLQCHRRICYKILSYLKVRSRKICQLAFAKKNNGRQYSEVQMAVTRFILVLVVLGSIHAKDPDLKVTNGQLTFDAEGNDNPLSLYFSRELHVPSRWSGITLGRGYDIKYKTQRTVVRNLMSIGMSWQVAFKIAGGVGKMGSKAKKYIKDNKLQSVVITRRQQKRLFQITYRQEAKEAKRLVNKYYKIKWGPLRKKIKDVLVDLKYRGDFRPTRSTETMKKLKAAVKRNSLRDLQKLMGDEDLWPNVPYDRFKRRRDYLK